MIKKYLNLEVYGNRVIFENIEFQKDDLSGYKFPFNYFIEFISTIEDSEENHFNKKKVLVGFEILIKVINTVENYEYENTNGWDEHYLNIFNKTFPIFNNYIEDKIDEKKLLADLAMILSAELNYIIKNCFKSEFILYLVSSINLEDISLRRNNKKLELELSNSRNKCNELLIELKKYENSSKNKTTVEIYKKINEDFKVLEDKYRKYFFIFLILTLLFTVGYNPLMGIWSNVISLLCSFSIDINNNCTTLNMESLYPFNGNTLKYIIFKVAVLLVGITLSTYYLRLTSFYQLRQEQAKQTKLELEAFPDFVSGMDKDIANNLRENLALKYFGKEVDKTQIDKSADLIHDQISAGTELIRASAEMLKAKDEANSNGENK